MGLERHAVILCNRKNKECEKERKIERERERERERKEEDDMALKVIKIKGQKCIA